MKRKKIYISDSEDSDMNLILGEKKPKFSEDVKKVTSISEEKSKKKSKIIEDSDDDYSMTDDIKNYKF
jgi:hypothetical protein